MSTLRNPRVVQFIGVRFLPGLRLPALVMERLACRLHDLLEPIPALPVKPYIPLYLKCSLIRDVARGLAYLHRRTPPVIHRDLTARNILLDSAMVAKIADLGVARIVRHLLSAAAMTKAPGASVYMLRSLLQFLTDRNQNTTPASTSSLLGLSPFSLSVKPFPATHWSPHTSMTVGH